jgi:hypothetical protein
MKDMDRAASQPLLPYYEIFSVDLTEGTANSRSAVVLVLVVSQFSCAY